MKRKQLQHKKRQHCYTCTEVLEPPPPLVVSRTLASACRPLEPAT